MAVRGGTSPDERLNHGLAALGLELPAETRRALLTHLHELERWNSAYNLTAVRDPGEMVTRHLLDSLALVPLLAPLPPGRLIDVGAGAGFPGITLALALPQWRVAVLDSNGKKARFLRHVVRTLGLEVDVIEARAEQHAPGPIYDCVVSRAFASLADFTDWTAHFLAPGGQWLAMKGKLEEDELAALPPQVHILARHRLQVPGLPEERHALALAPAS